MRISREEHSSGSKNIFTVIREKYADHSFFYINFSIPKSNDISSALLELSEYIRVNGFEVLMAFGFGFNKGRMAGTLNKNLPLLLLYHGSSEYSKVQLICTDSKRVEVKSFKEDIILKIMPHNGIKIYFINNIITDISGDHFIQAYNTFDTLKSILKKYKIPYGGLARTWLYIENILDWYDELNRARNDFFELENIFQELIPASTGIGLTNTSGKLISISAYALAGRKHDCSIRMIESPMQCPAIEYKSSFSRAVEIVMHSSKRLLISGTASISSSGLTLHKNNIIKQIEHTMEVVKSIMLTEDYKWDNTVRAIAYFKYPGDQKYFFDYCSKNNIDCSFILTVGGTVCRDELLFEIELDAVKPGNP